MKQEVIATAKTVDMAVENGAKMLGLTSADVTYEIIDMPKKGFLGIGEVAAKVRVICELKPEKIAKSFVETIIKDMELDAEVEMTNSIPTDGKGGKNDKTIMISGEKAGVLIGHHGDTLDALQYLTNLAANKKEDENDTRDYTRITVDIENYREKRVETLRTLARRMAGKVLKYKKSITLEPMNPYERRIIHSEVQLIDGVSTTSVGAENNRKVVIFLENGNNEPRTAAAPSRNSAKLAPKPAAKSEASRYDYRADTFQLKSVQKRSPQQRPQKMTIEEAFGHLDDENDEIVDEITETEFAEETYSEDEEKTGGEE